MEYVPSTRPVMEQIDSQFEPASEPVTITPVPSAPTTTNLVVITSLSPPTLIVESTSSTTVTDPVSSVTGMLMPMETPPLLTISSVPLMTAPVTSSTVITIKPMETSLSVITRSPVLIEVEKKFVAELIDNFYKSLNRCLLLVLESSTTTFGCLKVVLSWAIKNIRDHGEADHTAFLELMVEDLEKDMNE